MQETFPLGFDFAEPAPPISVTAGTPAPNSSFVAAFAAKSTEVTLKRTLGQYDTPPWAAEALWTAHLRHLRPGSTVWESCAGTGNMLAAIPEDMKVLASEIDPVRARQAEANTNREVWIGDCMTFPLPTHIHALFTNPPWEIDFIDALLERTRNHIVIGGMALMLLPTRFHNSATRVLHHARSFTIQQFAVSRTMFPGLIESAAVYTFRRTHKPKLIGFTLYDLFAEVQNLPSSIRAALAAPVRGIRSVWRRLIVATMRKLGRLVSIETLYALIGPARPTRTSHWKEQIRKQLQDDRFFRRVNRGQYALTPLALAS